MTGKEIRSMRKSLGLRQHELGSLVGVQPGTIARWEKDNGKPAPFQAALFDRFADVIDRGKVPADLREKLQSPGPLWCLWLLLSITEGVM